jgi:hypothetical protein
LPPTYETDSTVAAPYRQKFSAEEKLRIVLEGLRGEESIAGNRIRRRVDPVKLSGLESRGPDGRVRRVAPSALQSRKDSIT